MTHEWLWLSIWFAAKWILHWHQLIFPVDIDECANETVCGRHAFCDNTEGSFRCLCDRGYENSPLGHDCVGKSHSISIVPHCFLALGTNNLPTCGQEPFVLPGMCACFYSDFYSVPIKAKTVVYRVRFLVYLLQYYIQWTTTDHQNFGLGFSPPLSGGVRTEAETFCIQSSTTELWPHS